MATGYSLGGLVRDLYALVYPIGICVDFWDGTNPNTTFPGTTWVLINDGLYVRSSNTTTVGTAPGNIGATGGAVTATLGVANMPAHAHDFAHYHTISHDHGIGWTNADGGAHQHGFSANTSTNGSHQHHFISLTQFNGAGATPAAVYAGAQRDSYTDAAGDHYHSFSGITDWAGVHSHTVAVPTYNGNSSWVVGSGSGNNNTSTVGSGAAFSIENSFRCYGRWRRTA